MGTWVIDVFANETDTSPVHRALAKGDTEEQALEEASKAYPNDKCVASLNDVFSDEKALKTIIPTVKELW